MKPKSIFYASLCVFFILLWWKSDINTIEYNIENFLIIHNYLKRSYFKIITRIVKDKNQIHNIKKSSEKIDTFIIPMSKKLTKELGKYVRGDEILHDININISEPNINIFLFPDTFIKKTKIQYYKMFLENIYIIIGQESDNLNDENSKLLLESLVI
jgi:hypothetical protein